MPDLHPEEARLYAVATRGRPVLTAWERVKRLLRSIIQRDAL